MAIVLGLNCKLFRGDSGAIATTLMSNVKDVTLNMENGEADVTTRAANGWRAYAPTLTEASIEFNMNYDVTDSDYAAIANAFLAKTPIAFFVSDGAGNGLDADVVITNFSSEEPLEEAKTMNVTARIAATGRVPNVISDGSGTGGNIIGGTLTIAGDEFVGETLTAVTTGITPNGAIAGLTFQWYADNVAITGATVGTYTLTASDAGTKIKVKVTAGEGYIGEVTSAETEEIVEP